MPAERTAFVTGGSGFIGSALIRRLRHDGFSVRALARSEEAAGTVGRLGAEPVRGDLEDLAALETGASGCELAFHAAATVADSGSRQEYLKVNLEGTRKVVEGCRAAGVRRLVHVGTEAAIMAGEPLVMVDEGAPLRPDSKCGYCASKAMAERVVRNASGNGLETVVVRPRLVWGPGDATVLPQLIEAIEGGRFAWIGGGQHRTSTTYVDNAVEGLVLGAERGRPGEAYFVTDGEPVVFREFITDLLAARGVEPPDRTLPLPVARAMAFAADELWGTLPLPGSPPLTRTALWLSSLEVTIDISKARAELGYEPPVSIAGGLERLRLEA